MHRLALLAPALLATGACAAQVDGTNQGVPLAILTGTMHSDRATPLEHPEVSLVWAQESHMFGITAAEKVDATGHFPDFELDVYSPPPDGVYDEIDGERYTVGLLAVGTGDTDFTVPTNWFGIDFDRVVVYLPDGTQPGGTLEAMLHGAQTPGFHVFSVKRLTEQERQAVLDCINSLPDHSGPDLPWREVFTVCGGDSNDELYPVATDLDTLFELEIVAEQDILTIVNKLPQW